MLKSLETKLALKEDEIDALKDGHLDTRRPISSSGYDDIQRASGYYDVSGKSLSKQEVETSQHEHSDLIGGDGADKFSVGQHFKGRLKNVTLKYIESYEFILYLILRIC